LRAGRRIALEVTAMRARFFVGLGIVGLLALLTTGVVLAQDEQLGGKLLSGNEVTIPAGTTVDHDVYVFAGTVISNGTINGDLVVAGGNVTVNGPVNGDVLVVGGNITIPGNISEDVAAAGGQVTVSGRVGQDLLVSAGNLTLAGSVAGSTTGSAGTYNKSGTVGGSDGIVINPRTAPATPGNPVLDVVRQFIAVLLIAAIALWLVPRAFAAAETRVREQPLPSFGWGVATLIGYVVAVIAVIVVAILVAIVFGALGFGGLLGVDLLGGLVAILGLTLAFIVAGGFLADAIVGLALARLVVLRTASGMPGTPEAPAATRGPWSDLGLLAAGTAVVVILSAIPVLGGLVKFVVASLGLGALWLTWRASRLRVTPSIPIPPPAPTAPTT
jgi:hypothetical protein